MDSEAVLHDMNANQVSSTRKVSGELLLLDSHNQPYIHIYMQKHIQHNKDERRHSSLEKYTSHFIERAVCERGIGDWTKTATYWPPQLLRP